MRSLRRNKRKSIILPEITLTPLIDTVLTLLIIFMVTTPMIQNSLKISLPEAKSAKNDILNNQNPLEIFLDEKENLYINNKPLGYADLKKVVSDELKKSQNKIIVIKADKLIKYERIIKLLDQINSIEGEKYVALAAKHYS